MTITVNFTDDELFELICAEEAAKVLAADGMRIYANWDEFNHVSSMFEDAYNRHQAMQDKLISLRKLINPTK
jgi:hypothetical protein